MSHEAKNPTVGHLAHRLSNEIGTALHTAQNGVHMLPDGDPRKSQLFSVSQRLNQLIGEMQQLRDAQT